MVPAYGLGLVRPALERHYYAAASWRRAKLVLIIVDGLAPDTLATAVASGAAPNLGMLVERGGLGQAVSTFPSLTPVCLSTIATGAGPDQTRIPALQWYHRGEQRFVEYGSSFQATLVEGAKQSVDDAVVNLNHVHLSPKLRTLFELVEDAGMVAASVNFPIWRGRVRHSFKYPMLARFARRTGFMDAAYGPSQFYFGELFATERTGAPTSPAWAVATTRTPRPWDAGSWRATASTSCCSTCPRPTRPGTRAAMPCDRRPSPARTMRSRR